MAVDFSDPAEFEQWKDQYPHGFWERKPPYAIRDREFIFDRAKFDDVCRGIKILYEAYKASEGCGHYGTCGVVSLFEKQGPDQRLEVYALAMEPQKSGGPSCGTPMDHKLAEVYMKDGTAVGRIHGHPACAINDIGFVYMFNRAIYS